MEIANQIYVTSNIYEINVKGYYSEAFYDSLIKKNYCDTVQGFGRIIFKGTPKQYNEYLDYLVTNEGKFGFKII